MQNTEDDCMLARPHPGLLPQRLLQAPHSQTSFLARCIVPNEIDLSSKETDTTYLNRRSIDIYSFW